MPTIVVGGKNPDCPLCGKAFERAAVSIDTEYYFCRKDKIMIFTNDPMVGKWDNKDPETDIPIPCAVPTCKSEMKIFCRSDGFMKAVCPNPECGAVIASEEIEDGAFITEPGKGDELTKGED